MLFRSPAFPAAGYRVIAFDRRGYGRTVVDPSGPQPGTAADDLEALVKSLNIDRFHLIGTAAGGFVALDYALSFPNRVRSLVVANSIGGVTDPDYVALGHWNRPAKVGPTGIHAYYSGSPELAGTVNVVRLRDDGTVRVHAEPIRWDSALTAPAP